jgi:hypothetical protein
VAVGWKVLGIDLVRSNLARTVVGTLATINAVGAITALRPVATVVAITTAAAVTAIIAIASPAVAIAATKLAITRVLPHGAGIGSLRSGIGHLWCVYDCGRSLTLGRIDAGILRLGRSAAAPPSCTGLGLLDLALAVIGWCLIQGFLVRQLRSSSSGTVGT